MRKLAIITLLLCALPIFAQLSKVEKVLQEADFHNNREEYSLAIPYYIEYLKTNDHDYEAFHRLGVCYFRVKDFEKARENFRRAALLCPVNEKEKLATYYSNLSAAYSYLQDYEKGFQYALKAYNINETLLTLFNAASLANNNNRFSEGIKLLDRSKLTKNNNFNALYGLFYYKEGNYEKSIKYYEEFFSKYDPVNNTTDFIMEDEKLNLFKSYLSSAANPSNKFDQERLQKITTLYLDILQSEAKNELFGLFRDETRVWNNNERSAALINELIKKNPKKFPVENAIAILLAQKNMIQLYHFSNDYLQENIITDDKELFALRSSRYIGFLYMVLTNIPSKTSAISEENTMILKQYFDEIYSKKSYADEELTEQIVAPLKSTLKMFGEIYKSRDDQKKIAPTVLKIVEDFPNKKFREKIQEMLRNGRLEN